MQQHLRCHNFWQHLLSYFRTSRGLRRKHHLHQQLRRQHLLAQRNRQPVQRHLRSSVGYHDLIPRLASCLSVRHLYSRDHPEEQLQLRLDLWVDQLDDCQLHYDHGLRDDFRFYELPLHDLPQLERLHLQQHLRRDDFWQRLLSFNCSSGGFSR